MNSSELFFVTKWLSVPREKLELTIDTRDIISYFSLMIFQFQDFRKRNKENESIKWEWWNFCNLLFVVLLFLFATFKLFLRHSFNIFFFAKEQDRKRPLQAEYVTRKLKWKFAIRDSWFVTILVRKLYQKPPSPPPPPYDPLWSIGLKVDFFPINGIDPFGGFKCQTRIRKTSLRKTGFIL